jgi:hypothetical protein
VRRENVDLSDADRRAGAKHGAEDRESEARAHHAVFHFS